MENLRQPSNQLTTKQVGVRQLLEKMKSQFAFALPSILTPDRFVRVALTCINKNPKLLNCTQPSLLSCLLDCAQLGIEPDGRRAHLIPYGNVCTLIVDYKGIAELVRRSGEISALKAGIVYPSDEFDYLFGTNQFLKHKPNLKRDKKEKPFCVYSYVKLKDGEEDFDVMSIDDVDRIRSRSKAANAGPWVTDYDEMAKKTVFRRHSKWLPLSPELRSKIEKDDEPLTETERFKSARDVTPVETGTVSAITFTEEIVVDQDGGEPAFSPEPVTSPEPHRRRGRPKKEEVPPQPLATPIEGLRNLMRTSGIEEPALLAELFGRQLIEQGDKLDDLHITKVEWIKANWAELVSDIRGE